ncbi:Protein kinase-like domain superfamily [Arabidopsis suecica]|uniref:Receptor-like serine/threonine-protein kinase n=1 Tax=Arabidopsis suecica TaxID=45249 RepID=A0A8T1ZR60_ARASU|nr:Protein kinase-like domain superfamily [Arabidopsis suecica]
MFHFNMNLVIHHAYSLLFFFFIFLPAFSMSTSKLLSTETLTSNRTIVSQRSLFELGFFQLASDRWYVGIWYKNLPERTVVWVANREVPLSNTFGKLKFSDNNLVLVDQAGTRVWGTNFMGAVGSELVSELLDDGNFVIKNRGDNDTAGFLWQSFDFPTDTLLPGMALGWNYQRGINRYLVAWVTPDNPSKAGYTLNLKPRRWGEEYVSSSFPELFVTNARNLLYRTGTSIDLFLYTTEMYEDLLLEKGPLDDRQEQSPMDEAFLKDEIYIPAVQEVSFTAYNDSIFTRLTLSPDGILQHLTWNQTVEKWIESWHAPADKCDKFNLCGSFSYCDTKKSPVCRCLRGYTPRTETESIGCQLKKKRSCHIKEFFRQRNMRLPDTTASDMYLLGLEECKGNCVSDCSCIAFAVWVSANGSTVCIIWYEAHGLVDLRYSDYGQDLYLKMDPSEPDEKRTWVYIVIGVSVGIGLLIIMIIIAFIIFRFSKKKQQRAKAMAERIEGSPETEDLEIPLTNFETVSVATDNFSLTNKLGTGGFGTVFKGKLPDGNNIAVKRLSKASSQGTEEFMNEAKLIARLRHRNLVRLLSCCVDSGEKILIYEYLENLSLDCHLFDETRRSKLNWQRRFDIAIGIARGLLYLHQDSQYRIIHRDLKASNVLLDKDMTPKISDFGMARLVREDEIEANTMRRAGTYGYMAPEYAMGGTFSTKSDVYSFGVLLLEIVSGKKGIGSYDSTEDRTLPGWVWRKWSEGNALEVIDPVIRDSPSSSLAPASVFREKEVLRSIHVGLLCVQELSEDRPSMSSVLWLLGNENAEIPQPKASRYYARI